MILQIALGILLAVAILYCLPLILVGGVFLIGLALLVGLVALGIAFWPNLLLLPLLALSFGIPCAIYRWMTRRFRWFLLALDGKPPYEGWSRVPLRLAITAPIVLSLVVLGFAIAAGSATVFEPIYNAARK